MGDDDVLVVVDRPGVTVLLVLFQAGHSVRGEQTSVLGHAQRLALFTGQGSVLRQQPSNFQLN